MRKISSPEPQSCDLVVSLAGHDRGRLYMVVGSQGGRLLLCDGRLRRLDNPKQKSPAHVRVAARGTALPRSDKEIRLTLAQAAAVAAAREEEHHGER